MFFKELISLTFILLIFFKSDPCNADSKDDALPYLKENFLNNLIILKEPIEILNFEVVTEHEEKIQLDLNKEIILINFWATWCTPCREEMPSFNNLQNYFNDENFQVITVASGRNNLKKIKSFFFDLGINSLSLYRDPKGNISITNNVFALPTTLIVKNGYEVARLIGPADWNNINVIEYIDNILKSNLKN